MILSPRGTLAISGDIFVVMILGGMLLANSGWRRGMWLNILQCTGQTLQRITWPQMPIVPRLRNSPLGIEFTINPPPRWAVPFTFSWFQLVSGRQVYKRQVPWDKLIWRNSRLHNSGYWQVDLGNLPPQVIQEDWNKIAQSYFQGKYPNYTEFCEHSWSQELEVNIWNQTWMLE